MQKFRQTSGPQYFGSAKKNSIFDTNNNNAHPGPGAHSPNHTSSSALPQWKMGLSTARNSFLDPHRAAIPSPQHYHVSHHEVQKISKKMSFPLSSPIDKPNSNNLKNCYDVTHSLTKTALPLFSFGHTIDPDYTTLAPGPGSYDLPKPKITFNKTQSGFSIGQRPAPYGDEVKVPSPDKYHPNATLQSPKYSFGRAARLQMNCSDAPGKFYDLDSKKTIIKLGRGQSTQYKREPTFLISKEGPAPNAYQVDLRNKISGGVLEASKRSPIENAAICEYPSSDKYVSHQDLDLKRGASFIKDDRHLNATSDGIPGPGSYLLMSTLSRIGAALPKKPKKKDEDEAKVDFPGPAAYNPKDSITRRKGGSTIVLRANREDFSKSLTKQVGPGAYEIAGSFEGELGKIGKSTRRPLQLPNHSPGVGMYDIQSQIGHQHKRSGLTDASIKSDRQKHVKAGRKGQGSVGKSEMEYSVQQGNNPESERIPVQQQVKDI